MGEPDWVNSQLINPNSLPLVVCSSPHNPLGKLLIRTQGSGEEATYFANMEDTGTIFNLSSNMGVAVVLHNNLTPSDTDLFYDGVVLLKEMMSLAMILSSTQTSPAYYNEMGRFVSGDGEVFSDQKSLGLSLTYEFLSSKKMLPVFDAFPIFAMAKAFGKVNKKDFTGSAKRVTQTLNGAHDIVESNTQLGDVAQEYMTAWLGDFGKYPDPGIFDINQLLKNDEVVAACSEFYTKMTSSSDQ